MTAEHFSGALELPVTLTEQSPGAPLLQSLVDEYALAIEKLCGDAWSVLYPGEPIVREKFARDPTEGDFLAGDLPALFLWTARTGGAENTEQIADDIRVQTTVCSMMWIPHPVEDLRWQESAQFWTALDRAVRIVSGKHGSSMHNTDSTWGGDLCTRLGLWDLSVLGTEPTEVNIEMESASAQYMCSLWTIEVKESMGTTITSPAQPVGSPKLTAIYTTGGSDPLPLYESRYPTNQ